MKVMSIVLTLVILVIITKVTSIHRGFCDAQAYEKRVIGAGFSLGLLTKCVIILDQSLSRGLERGRHLEINLEFSLIAVYRFRRGSVLFFIFLHK